MDEHIAMIRNMLPHRSTHLYDALYQALEQLSMVQDRKALFLFTDGDDEGSTTTREDAVMAITGQEDVGTTLILTEGFGTLAMAEQAFAILREREGRQASMNGATQIRA